VSSEAGVRECVDLTPTGLLLLFELTCNRRERRVEFWADPFDGRDYCKRNASGNKAVFDGRRTGFVSEKCFQREQHVE
jgi:hypothetical protein